MKPQLLSLCGLLLATLVGVTAQTLFNTSTTGPAPLKGTAPQPIEIQSSGQASFSMKTDKLTYQNNVRVNDSQFFLRCDNLMLQLDLAGTRKTNQPPPLTAPFSGAIRGIREVDATGGVVFSNKVDGSHALADRIQYFATNDAFELTGNARVVKNFGTNNVVTNSAPRIVFHRARGEFISYGEVTTQGGYSQPAKKTNAPAGKTSP